jgi:hypothetical protein
VRIDYDLYNYGSLQPKMSRKAKTKQKREGANRVTTVQPSSRHTSVIAMPSVTMGSIQQNNTSAFPFLFSSLEREEKCVPIVKIMPACIITGFSLSNIPYRNMKRGIEGKVEGGEG